MLPVSKEVRGTLMGKAPISQHLQLGVKPLCDVVHEAVCLLFLLCHDVLPCGRTSMTVWVEWRSRLSDDSFGGFTVSPVWSRRVF